MKAPHGAFVSCVSWKNSITIVSNSQIMMLLARADHYKRYQGKLSSLLVDQCHSKINPSVKYHVWVLYGSGAMARTNLARPDHSQTRTLILVFLVCKINFHDKIWSRTYSIDTDFFDKKISYLCPKTMDALPSALSKTAPWLRYWLCHITIGP